MRRLQLQLLFVLLALPYPAAGRRPMLRHLLYRLPLPGHFVTFVEEAVASLRATASPTAYSPPPRQATPVLVLIDPTHAQAPVAYTPATASESAVPTSVAVVYAISPRDADIYHDSVEALPPCLDAHAPPNSQAWRK